MQENQYLELGLFLFIHHDYRLKFQGH